MKVSQETDDILLDYLDGNLDETKKQQLEAAVRQQPELKARLEALSAVSILLGAQGAQEPSRNFTSRVMARLDQYPQQAGYSIQNGLYLLTGVLAVSVLAMLLVATGAFDNSITHIDLGTIEVFKKIGNKTLPAFSISNKLLVNIIIMLNLILAWVVLDRVILKPWFARRMASGL
jgi:hypothetical protein